MESLPKKEEVEEEIEIEGNNSEGQEESEDSKSQHELSEENKNINEQEIEIEEEDKTINKRNQGELNSKEKNKNIQINTIKKFIGGENIDMSITCLNYSNLSIPYEKMIQLVTKNSKKGLVGLKNISNNGYMNSILQCLSHNPEIVYFYTSDLYLNYVKKKSTPKQNEKILLSNCFSELLKNLWIETEKTYVPSNFRFKVFELNHFYNNSNHHDAEEFLYYLLDKLDEDSLPIASGLNPTKNINHFYEAPKLDSESDLAASQRFWSFFKNSNNSIIKELFFGQLKSTIKCITCSYTKTDFEVFSILPLDIPNLKKISVLLIPSNNIKRIIKLTLFVSESALFIDIGTYIKQYINSGFDSYKVMLINYKNSSCKFVKMSENIFNLSKKGMIAVYEIDDSVYNEENSINEDEEYNDDYFPFITIIRKSLDDFIFTPEKKKEEKLPQKINKTKSNKLEQKEEFIGDKDKEILSNKDSSVNEISLNESEISMTMENKKGRPKYSSFPRIFPVSSYSKIKTLRCKIFGFLLKYFPIPSTLYDTSEYTQLKKNYSENNTELDDSGLNLIYQKIYNEIFNPNNYEKYSEYLSKFPFEVYFTSPKPGAEEKLFFSNNSNEYQKEFQDNQSIHQITNLAKRGYKISIVVKDPLILTELNKLVSIESKEDKKVTLKDCLINFTLHEKLEKENEWFCPKCSKLCNAFKKLDLFYLPNYVIITLKRFNKNYIGKNKIQLIKNTDLVEFPTEKFSFENYLLGPKIPKPIYELYSVCQHSGSIEGGRYVASCKSRGSWYMYDDTSVFPCEEDMICTPEGYILFFKKQKERIGELKIK